MSKNKNPNKTILECILEDRGVQYDNHEFKRRSISGDLLNFLIDTNFDTGLELHLDNKPNSSNAFNRAAALCYDKAYEEDTLWNERLQSIPYLPSKDYLPRQIT